MADKQRGLLIKLQKKENNDLYPIWQTDIVEFSSPPPESLTMAITAKITIANTIKYDKTWNDSQLKAECKKNTTNAVYLGEPVDRHIIEDICKDEGCPYAFLKFGGNAEAPNGGGVDVSELNMKMKGEGKGPNGDPAKLFFELTFRDGSKVNNSAG